MKVKRNYGRLISVRGLTEVFVFISLPEQIDTTNITGTSAKPPTYLCTLSLHNSPTTLRVYTPFRGKSKLLNMQSKFSASN